VKTSRIFCIRRLDARARGERWLDPLVETARVPLVAEDDRTFGRNNEGFYWKGGRATGAAIPTTRSGARPFNVL